MPTTALIRQRAPSHESSAFLRRREHADVRRERRGAGGEPPDRDPRRARLGAAGPGRADGNHDPAAAARMGVRDGMHASGLLPPGPYSGGRPEPLRHLAPDVECAGRAGDRHRRAPVADPVRCPDRGRCLGRPRLPPTGAADPAGRPAQRDAARPRRRPLLQPHPDRLGRWGGRGLCGPGGGGELHGDHRPRGKCGRLGSRDGRDAGPGRRPGGPRAAERQSSVSHRSGTGRAPTEPT